MEYPRSSSLLPTIKCSNCAADIQISLITQHVCNINGYLTPAELTPTSTKMSNEMLPNLSMPDSTFLQPGPFTPISLLSSPASISRLPFSNSNQSPSNTLSGNLTPKEPLSPDKISPTSEIPSSRNPLLNSRLDEKSEQAMNKIRSGTSSDNEPNQMSAVINPKSIDNSDFFLKVNKIAPGPFDINAKVDIPDHAENDNHRKLSVGDPSDTIAGKSFLGRVDNRPPLVRGHFHKNSGSLINSKTNYTTLPKVPRKSGYDGFGPPSSDSNGISKPRSSSDSQYFLPTNKLSPQLPTISNLELENQITSSEEEVNKSEGSDISKSISDQVSTLSVEIDNKKLDKLQPLQLQENIDESPKSPPPSKNFDKLLPLPYEEKNNELPTPPPQIVLDEIPLLPPKDKVYKLLPSPPQENIDQPPSPLPQKNLDEISLLPPKNKVDKSLPLPPPDKFDEILLPPSQIDLEKRPQFGINNQEDDQPSLLEKPNDIEENSNSKSYDPNIQKYQRRNSKLSHINNLMADIESTMSGLGLNERLSTGSSSSSSTQISIPTTDKSLSNFNSKQQISRQNKIPINPPLSLIPAATLHSSIFLNNHNGKRPIFSQKNSSSTKSSGVSPINGVHLIGLPTNPSPRFRTRSPLDKPRKSKGKCKECGEDIYGKSVSSADGRLTGRYHKECFVCRICQKPFNSTSCYVINDAPYCEAHYHEINGSICFTCNKGIEGKYVETDRRQKHHPSCLRCADCGHILQNNYFEMNGLLYCKRDAYQRAKQNNYLNSEMNEKSSQIDRQPKRLVMT